MTFGLPNKCGFSQDPILKGLVKKRLCLVHQVLQFFDPVTGKMRSANIDKERRERYSSHDEPKNTGEDGKAHSDRNEEYSTSRATSLPAER